MGPAGWIHVQRRPIECGEFCLSRAEFKVVTQFYKPVAIIVGFCVEGMLPCNSWVSSMIVKSDSDIEVAVDQINIVPFLLALGGMQGPGRIHPFHGLVLFQLGNKQLCQSVDGCRRRLRL